jgi:hypothetical protein
MVEGFLPAGSGASVVDVGLLVEVEEFPPDGLVCVLPQAAIDMASAATIATAAAAAPPRITTANATSGPAQTNLTAMTTDPGDGRAPAAMGLVNAGSSPSPLAGSARS